MKEKLARALGLAATIPLLAIGLVASAQTTSTDTTGATTDTTGTTVTAPNTGAGADAPFNVALIGASVLVLGAGALYLARERRA